MSRDPNPVTVVLPIGAALLRRLNAVAADLHLDRPEALHTALLCWLEQEERQTAVRDRMRTLRALTTAVVHADIA